MKKIFNLVSNFKLLVFILIFSPLPAFAATKGLICTAEGSIGFLICRIHQILSAIIPILILVGVVYFVWGVVQYMIADAEEAKKKGKEHIIYGIIGLAVIVGLWGLVNVVVTTFGLGEQSLNVPSLVPVQNTADSSVCSFGENVQGVLGYITCIINNSVIPFIFAIATVMFIWGAVKFFIIDADEEAKRDQGKQFMIWGIIALTVMLSVWGLVAILGDTFGVDTSVLPHVSPGE